MYQSDDLLHSTKALSIQVRQVSWLVTILPSFPLRCGRNSGHLIGKNCGVLLTVAGQLVIYTQFPINPRYEPGNLLRLMKKYSKELVLRKCTTIEPRKHGEHGAAQGFLFF